MPEEQYRAFSRHLVPVDLPLGLQLSSPDEEIEYIYFPVSGLISVDALTRKGESVEVGVIGREGISGIAAVLGHCQMSHSVNIQHPGTGLRVRSALVRAEFLKGGSMMAALHTFLYLQMVQSTQSVLCNRLHPIDARMARWLLTASDRTETLTLNLTQEFLAQMLGSRRSTVTVAAGIMQRDGLIEYTRGKVRIVDRARLQHRACECYGLVRSKYDELIGRDY